MSQIKTEETPKEEAKDGTKSLEVEKTELAPKETVADTLTQESMTKAFQSVLEPVLKDLDTKAIERENLLKKEILDYIEELR